MKDILADKSAVTTSEYISIWEWLNLQKGLRNISIEGRAKKEGHLPTYTGNQANNDTGYSKN